MKDFEFRYGDGAVKLSLPEAARVEVLRGRAQAALEDIGAALRDALESPIGAAPLRAFLEKSDRVTLLFTLSTLIARFWAEGCGR